MQIDNLQAQCQKTALPSCTWEEEMWVEKDLANVPLREMQPRPSLVGIRHENSDHVRNGLMLL